MYKNTYTCTREIDYYDTDRFGNMKISAIMRHCAVAGDEHCVEHGFNHKFFIKHDASFVLSRINIDILKYPEYNDTVIVKTWQSDISGPFYQRIVLFYDTSDNLLLEYVSSWLLVTISTRRIIKPATFKHNLPVHIEEKFQLKKTDKLKAQEGYRKVYSRYIGESSIDTNGHLNNAVYADIACDALDEQPSGKKIKSFKLNFIKECFCRETMDVHTVKLNGKYYIKGEISNSISFLSEIEF